MALDFVALDRETANRARGSACAVGVVRVVNSGVADTWSTLIQPPERFATFDARNTQVHGLGADDVADAQRFADVWPAARHARVLHARRGCCRGQRRPDLASRRLERRTGRR